MWQKLKQLQQRLKDLFERYGTVALGTWFAIFVSTIALFYGLISAGMDVQGTLQGWGLELDPKYLAAGKVMLAYGCAQLTKPLRILLTVAIVPPLARWLERRRAPAE